MKPNQTIRGVLFDMDGTMIDNMMVHHRTWQLVLADLELDLTLEEVRQTIHGKNEEILARLFGDKYGPAEIAEYAYLKEARYRKVFADDLALIDGLPAFLDDLQKHQIPMAIGTAAPQENVDWAMETLNLGQYFDTVIHAGMVQRGKPDPQVFEMAAAGIGLTTSECVVFEDSPTGVKTALNAGCPCIVITTTHTVSEFDAFPNILAFISDFRGLDAAAVMALCG
jgi:beta-phosphoglucomutase